ncbi:hypothetical protein IMCC1989_813 [gamma proteobacterium IMCC1989]|nr:hypothetical protein IMCC1989_813 [gamma proteobacterium IMCC1989]
MKYFLKTAIKKSTLTTLTILTSSILLASNVYAHAPELHKKKNAEKPKCEAMKDMDHSKMDMNDPITQAMMKQCMASEHHGDNVHKEMTEHQESKKEKHEDNGHHGDMKKKH